MARIHEHTVNIAAPLTLVSAIPLAMQGDSEADELRLHVVNGKEQADMTGFAVGGYLERADGIRVMLKGSVTADAVEVKLQEACYRVPGAYKAFVRLSKSTGEKMTLFLFAGYIESEGDGEIVDEEDTLPSVEELIAMIEEIDRAIKGADAAAAVALKAAENADRAGKAASDAANEANAAADAADEAAEGASAWAKATMEAESLPEGSAPTIAVGKNESGGNVIRVGIPAGRTGEAGVTPQITFEVETGAAGSDVKVEQSGTAEAPHIKLTIPRGDTGAVEGVDYYEGNPEPLGKANPGTANGLSRGNHVHPMPTAEEVGARPDTWTPTAEDVGARPNTWTPTAEETGALPSNGTAADSEKLGGQMPSHYATAEYVNRLSQQKADKEGWTPNKIIGTDAEGKLVTQDMPEGGSDVEVDTTLTQEGKAADAKATGDALGLIELKLANKMDVPAQTIYKAAWVAAKSNSGLIRLTDNLVLPSGLYFVEVGTPYADKEGRVLIGIVVTGLYERISPLYTFLNTRYDRTSYIIRCDGECTLYARSESDDACSWDANYLDRGGIVAVKIY